MNIKFDGTILDCAPGTEMYMLVYDSKNPVGMFMAPVRFKELQCKEVESRWGHQLFSEKDFFTAVFEYDTVLSSGKPKVKEIKVKWTHWPRHYKTEIKKGKHMFWIGGETEELNITCTPVVGTEVLVTDSKQVIKDILKKGNILEAGIKILEDQKKKVEIELEQFKKLINDFND